MKTKHESHLRSVKVGKEAILKGSLRGLEGSTADGVHPADHGAKRQSMRGGSWWWLGLVFLLGFPRIQAAVIINTLGSASPSTINKSGNASTGTFDAVMFDLEGSSASVDSVSLSLKSNVGTMTWIAGVFSSPLAGTAPTTFVGDLGTVSLSSTTFGSVAFTPPSPISLAADTRYWIVYGNTTLNQGAYQLAALPSDTVGNPAITVYPGTGTIGRWRSVGQNTLDLTTLSGITLTGGSTSTSTAPLFKVDGSLTAIPEPSSSLVALVLCGLAAVTRRLVRS